MFSVVAAQSEAADAREAAQTVIRRLARRCPGVRAGTGGALLVFANACFDRVRLLSELARELPGVPIVGCTSAAELGGDVGLSEWSVSAMFFTSDVVSFGCGLGEQVATDPLNAVATAVATTRAKLEGPPALCLMFAEGAAARDPVVVDALARELGPDCVIAGAAASRPLAEPGDTAAFFLGREVKDAIVLLVLAGPLRVRHDVSSGWTPVGSARTITATDGARVLRIGEQKALEYYRHYIGAHTDPTRGFPLAVFEDRGDDFYTRVPIATDEDSGSITFGAPIPAGSRVRLVEATASSILADLDAVHARMALTGFADRAALVFSCNARKGILGSRCQEELETLRRALPPSAPIAGFYGFAEIGPTDAGAPPRLHHATLVTVLMETTSPEPAENEATLPPPADSARTHAAELERENHMLRRKLGRSEYYRRDLETLRDGTDRMLKRVHSELSELYRALDDEKQKSERLLLNILPEQVARELKERGRVEAVHHGAATILFTDFRGFTRSASSMTPHELVAELDLFFSAFDEIVGRHDLEKLKTIGDAYMCAGGIPTASAEHIRQTVAAAWEIKQFCANLLEQRQAAGQPCWEIRIGVHTGPLLAGVIGQKKFAYDVWGDTVNVAARLESSSEPGRINVSREVHDAIVDAYVCEPRGKLPIKNRGELEMFFVTGPR